MNVYEDYKSWLTEEFDFLNAYKKTYIYDRYETIFLVLDKLLENEEEISEDEENIFTTAFYFIESQISDLKIWAKAYYENKYDEFFKNSRTILLMLFINEHLNEMENLKNLEKFKSLEEDVFNALKEKRTVSEDLYELVEQEIVNIYQINKIEHIDIVEIFIKIAQELQIDLY